MSQFQVPQFIETESKIVGPLSLKQFLYIAAAALLSFFLFFLLKTFVWVIFTSFLGIISVSLAFVKYNGRPLTTILKSAVSYLWQPRLYLWKKGEEAVKMPTLPRLPEKPSAVSPLKNLWLSLITKKPPTKPSV